MTRQRESHVSNALAAWEYSHCRQFLSVSPGPRSSWPSGAQLKRHEDLGPDLDALEEVQNVFVKHADATVGRESAD